MSDPDDGRDRRAWHRALAAAGPDEDVAAELEQSAGRAQARGGVAATAAFLQRAAALTPDPARRSGRALAAAQRSVQAGAFTTARGLLATAQAGPLDELQRAQIDLVRAQLAFVSSRGTDATPLLLAAARRLEPLDISVARETYVDAFSAALFGARLNGSVGVREIAEAARAARAPSDAEPATADLLLDALVALADDYASAVPLCREAVQRLSGEKASAKERLRWLWQGCVVAFEIWDDEHASSLSRSSVEIARATGTLSELALALSARTPVLVFCGDLAAAAATVAETASVEEATGIRAAPYGALMVSAWRGRPRETTDLIEMTEREAGARGEGIGLAISAYARAVLSNGLGRYEDALAAAVSASEYREVVAENWGLSELVEPATRCGRTDLADGRPEPAGRQGTGHANPLGARHRGACPGAARRRRRRRSLVPHSDRPSRPNSRSRRARPHTSAVRRMAAARRPPTRRARRAQHRARAVHVDGHGGVRAARRQRTRRDRREAPPAHRRDARRSHRAGASDRRAGPRRALEPGDRRPPVPQPAHRRVAPAPRLLEARDPVPTRTGKSPPRLGLRYHGNLRIADPGVSRRPTRGRPRVSPGAKRRTHRQSVGRQSRSRQPARQHKPHRNSALEGWPG